MILNFINLYIGHLKSSTNRIILITIGLIFTLGLLSASLIYFDSIKPALLTELMENRESSIMSRGDVSINADFSPFSKEAKNCSNIIKSNIEEISGNLRLFDKIEHIKSFLNLRGYLANITVNETDGNDTQTFSIGFLECNSKIMPELESIAVPESRLPSELSEAYLLSLTSLDDSNDSKVLISPGSNLTFTSRVPNAPLESINITAIGEIEIEYIFEYMLDTDYDKDLDWSLKGSFPGLNEYLTNIQPIPSILLFVPNISQFLDYLHPFTSTSTKSPQLKYRGEILFDVAKFDPFNLNLEIQRINDFINQLESSLVQLGAGHLSINFETETDWENLPGLFDRTMIVEIIIIIPMIFLTGFISSFAMGIIDYPIKTNLQVYKTRGLSKRATFSILILDLIIAILLAAILATVFLGFPIAWFLINYGSNSNLSEYRHLEVTINWGSVLLLSFIVGLIMSLLIDLERIVEYTRYDRPDIKSSREEIDPYWQRHYLDIYIFIIGISGYLIYDFGVTRGWFRIGTTIFTYLGIILCLTLGTVLISSRFFSFIFKYMENWRLVRENIISFLSFRNIAYYKKSTTRMITLITILIALLFAFITVSPTVSERTRVQIDYENGAEGLVVLHEYLNNADLSILKEIERNYTQYFKASPFLKIRSKLKNALFLAINVSTYLSVISTSVNFETSKPLNEAISELGTDGSTTVPKVILHEEAIRSRGTEVGSTVSLVIDNTKIQSFKIVDQFLYWANFYPYEKFYQDFYGVVNLDFFTSLRSNFSDLGYDFISAGLYLNFNEDVNQTQIARSIEDKYHVSVKLSGEEYKESMDSFLPGIQSDLITMNVVIGLEIGIFLVFAFSFMQFTERKKGTTMCYLLGLDRNQLTASFFLEFSVLLAYSLLFGNFFGVILASSYSLLLKGSSEIPISSLDIPFMTIISFQLIIALTAICASFLASWVVSTEKTFNAFLGEE